MNLSDLAFKVDKKSLLSLLLNLSLLLLILYPFLTPQRVNATVTEAFVRFDRLSTGAPISGTACLKTSTVGTETGVVIVFPLGWTISQTASNWTVSTTNLPKDPVGGGSATAWPGIGTATGVNGLSVAFPSSDLTTGTFYCFNFSGASSTVGSAGNDQTGQLKTTGGNPYVDSVNYATSVVASNAEQIVVTASVSATMTFSLNSNSVNLGTLTTSVTSGTAVTQTVATNARNGWISWMKSANGKLHSASANADISAGTYTTGSGNIVDLATNTGYVVDVNSGTGSPVIATEYDGNTTTKGGKLDTIFEQTASNSNPTGGDTADYVIRAKISSSQAAATDYTDTLTITAAGSF